MTYEELKALALASTDGDLSYCDFDSNDVSGIWKRTNASNLKLWVTYKYNDPPLSVAVTGNGPTSEANAKFFCIARDAVLHLLKQNEELRAALADALFWAAVKK